MDLHIAFSSDNNYVAHLGVAIISLLENNRKLNIINIHVLDNIRNLFNTFCTVRLYQNANDFTFPT